MATNKIVDAGMVLPGAPKDRAKNILKQFDFESLILNIYDSIGHSAPVPGGLELSDIDTRSVSSFEDWQKNLSKAKVWPSPSFVDLLESGIPYPIVLGLREVYDQFPSSPVFPSPEELSTLTDLLLAGKSFEDSLHDIWAPWVEHCATQPPSYLRILEQWTTLYSSYQHGYRRNEEMIAKADGLFSALPIETRNLLHHSCKQTDIAAGRFLGPAYDKFRSYSRLYSGKSLPLKEYKRYNKLYQDAERLKFIIGRDEGRGDREFTLSQIDRQSSAFTNLLRYLPSDLSDYETPEAADRYLGKQFAYCFKQLKNKPRLLSLDTPAGSTPSAEEAAKPKEEKLPIRPVRLNESETTALLSEVDTADLHNNPFYKSFDPLVEAGMIRGAQIGNWVTQKERPSLVRKNYDALMSLSQTLNITPSLIGLGNPISDEDKFITEDGLIADVYNGNQALGLAFGARGKSSAAAHFEPGLNVINLTRKKGAGSLAHEWAHSWDHRLGGLLNHSIINRKYNPTDLKRVTLSDSIRYFSEYAAMFWFFQTYKQSSFSDHATQERHHRAFIEDGLRDDLDLSPEQRQHVINLMVGMSHLVRDMYHVEKSPKQVTDQLLVNACKHFHTYAEGAGSFLRNVMNFAMEMSNDSADLSNDLLQWHGEMSAYLEDPECDPFDTNSYYLGSISGDRIRMALPDAIIVKLSAAARRDFLEEDKLRLAATLREYLDSSVMIVAVETVAERALTDTMMPPHPDKKEQQQRMALCWGAAVRDALQQAPIRFLKQLSMLNDRHEYGGHTIFHTPLAPTDMARAAGESSMSLMSERCTAAPLAGRIIKTLGSVISLPPSLSHFYQYQLVHKGLSPDSKAKISELDADVGTGISQLHEGLFHIPYLLDGIKAEHGHTPLKKDLETAYSTFDQETRQRNILPEYADKTQQELFNCLMQETNPLPFQLCVFEDSRFLTMALLDTHLKSEHHDGTWASVAESFLNPKRLQPFPAGLTTYLADFAARRAHAPSSAPTNQKEWDELINQLPQRLISNSTMKVLSAARHIKLHAGGDRLASQLDIAHADFMMTAFINALSTGDLSGLRRYDEAIRERGLRSFRYRENQENIELLSEFFPVVDRDAVIEELSPDKLIDHFHGNTHRGFQVSTSPGAEYSPDELRRQHRQRLINGLTGAIGLYAFSISRQISRFKDAEAARVADDIRYESIVMANGRLFKDSVLRFNISPYVRLSTQYENGQMSERGGVIVGKRRYWSETIELFARMTEKVIFERLEEAGSPDPFLVTTPTRKAQNARINAIKDIESGNYVASGKHYVLCYPAADDLDRMMATFDREVVPALQPALNALFPHSLPHYERYLTKMADQTSTGPNTLKILREDSFQSDIDLEDETTWVTPEDVGLGSAKHGQTVTGKASHEDFSLNPSSGPAL